jgi:hypothetical protein
LIFPHHAGWLLFVKLWRLGDDVGLRLLAHLFRARLRIALHLLVVRVAVTLGQALRCADTGFCFRSVLPC